MDKDNLKKRINQHIDRIYHGVISSDQVNSLSKDLFDKVIKHDSTAISSGSLNDSIWSEKTVVLITYANSIYNDSDSPLKSLDKFLSLHCKDFIDTVHILPFCPSSSDYGFAVKDYYSVDEEFGGWDDICNISEKFCLMADVVINHGSSKGIWFNNFLKGSGNGHDYFLSFEQKFDISKVVRPRTSPLLNSFTTNDGERYVWCTFGPDQVDYNFNNPQVLMEFIDIVIFYLSKGITTFRFDAVAFLWKKIGTSCINLYKTHEIVRLFRTILDCLSPKAILVTETNVPARENVSYFGNANEAHWIYNFSLPPILIYSILSGNSSHLENLTMSMPPSQSGTSYLNFIASHDGIGLRPVESFLSDMEIDSFIELMERNGGKISYHMGNTNVDKPYEINISLFDAMKETFSKENNLVIDRFVCIHTIMMSLEGVPAFYIHSLFGTESDYNLYKKTNHKRSLNRGVISLKEVDFLDGANKQVQIYNSLKKLLSIRKNQFAFHPNATQFTLHLGTSLYGVWRQSLDKKQDIFCISNLTEKNIELSLLDINLNTANQWTDLISQNRIDNDQSNIHLAPYQTIWLTNLG